jgi:tRNA G10  N-methylase Trm11
MPTYYCLLGNTPSLSLAELQVLYPNANVTSMAKQVAAIELADDEAAQSLMNRVGGTVKVIKHLENLSTSDPDQIQVAVAKVLAASEAAKVTFGVAEIGRDHLPPLNLFRIKSQLEEAGKRVRYVEGSRAGLSAAVLLHQTEVQEMNVLQLDHSLTLGQTVAIQDIDAWTVRDRHKPYADRRKGMLPPKVARIMVNIALSLTEVEKPLVYDPFCGTGTILIEALTQGCRVAGSDLDVEAITGTQKNLEWFTQLPENTEMAGLLGPVFQADVSQVAASQLPTKIDCLVTEPFLGKPQPRADQLANTFKGLQKLYLGAFKQWTQILNQDAVVVIIFPQVVSGKNTYGLEGLIDKLASLGYTIASEPVLYHRPQAIVQRQIVVFKYTK